MTRTTHISAPFCVLHVGLASDIRSIQAESTRSLAPSHKSASSSSTRRLDDSDLEHVMNADNFYSEEVKQETVEARPRSLSLSINKPDWSTMLNVDEKSMRITDTLLDTPEILGQFVDWELHRKPEAVDVVQQQAAQAFYIPETVDETTQITAIKNELQNDYENQNSPPVVVLQNVASPQAYYQYQNENEAPYSVNGDASSRTCDGSVSPAFSQNSSMVADDEDDDLWYPNGSGGRGRRVGRPKSTNGETGGAKAKAKASKRKLSEYAKESDEYKEKRKRNNIAVRKSRDKAKRHHVETEERNDILSKENNNLRKQNESLVREISVLRKLITDIGRKIPDQLAVSLDAYSA